MQTVHPPRAQPDVQALRRMVQALGPWFHNLHLPGGVQTVPDHFIGGDFPGFKWREIAPHVPRDLSGWRVLDVGCNAGFYSFELARRGASVLAVDVDEHYLAQARWAAGVYGLQDRVTFRHMGVYELAQLAEDYDLVWFMGVFYHLRYPLLALDLLARKTRRLMMFQTLTMPGDAVYPDTRDHPITERQPLLDPGWPKMAFIEHRFDGDPTNEPIYVVKSKGEFMMIFLAVMILLMTAAIGWVLNDLTYGSGKGSIDANIAAVIS